MALTKNGYKRETYEEILERMTVKAKTLLGDDVNLDVRSPAGFILRIIAWEQSLEWQDNENVYYSAFRHTAEGQQLDNLLPHAGITRNPAQPAYGPYIFRGEPGTLVPLGTIVTKSDDTQYFTVEEKRISSDGKATIEIVAVEPGASGNADVGEITTLLESISGIDGGSNTQAFTNGRERESDQEARKRADEATEGQGAATTASIQTALLKIPEVRAAYVDENYTEITNAFGTPPASVQAFVLGGSDEDIAQAIHQKRAGGIRPFGQTYYTIYDAGGVARETGFTRSKIITIYAKVKLTITTGFGATGEADVIREITQYIGGLDASGNAYAGLNMGDNVIMTKLIAQIYRVAGVADVDVQLSVDGVNYAHSNIEIDVQDVAQISNATIEVSYV